MFEPKPISGLPVATVPLAGTEAVAVVQDGETRQAPASEFGGAAVQTDVFTADGTWTKPEGAKYVEVYMVGGGSGGNGGNNNPGSSASGGGGGAGAGRAFDRYPASLLPSTVAITVGLGGAGGAGAPPGPFAVGSLGAAGGSSFFGEYLRAAGGEASSSQGAGAVNSGDNGRGNFGLDKIDSEGRNGGGGGTGTPADGQTANTNTPDIPCGGGGGGGKANTGGIGDQVGGADSSARPFYGAVFTQAQGGAAGGGQGEDTAVPYDGGGGGGGSNLTAGGRGGHGLLGGGGGGGGGAGQGGAGGGSGGNGGDGLVVVRTYF